MWAWGIILLPAAAEWPARWLACISVTLYVPVVLQKPDVPLMLNLIETLEFDSQQVPCLQP